MNKWQFLPHDLWFLNWKALRVNSCLYMPLDFRRLRKTSDFFRRLWNSSRIFGNDHVVLKNPSTPGIKISRLYLRKSWQVYEIRLSKMQLHAKLSFLHTLFLDNEVQIDQNKYGMMLFMSKQVSLSKISSILQKMKIGQKPVYALFAWRPLIIIISLFTSTWADLKPSFAVSNYGIAHVSVLVVLYVLLGLIYNCLSQFSVFM